MEEDSGSTVRPPAGGAAATVERVAYPAELERDVLLRDGTCVHVRPIRPADAEALVRFHEALSDSTVYRRFLSPHMHLSEQEVWRFTTVDYDTRMALVVHDAGTLVAVGRYDRLEGGRDAEVAFVVADAYQRRGVAPMLLAALAARARGRAIERFTASVLDWNAAMLKVFLRSGFPVTSLKQDGVIELQMSITEGRSC